MRKRKPLSMSIQIFMAMILGIIAGMLFGKSIAPIKLLGDIFIRLIQMSIVLLVMGQVIEAVGSLNIKRSGKIIGQAVVIFLISSLAAAVFGIVMAVLFTPGAGASFSGAAKAQYTAGKMPGISQIILDFFPNNVFDAMAKGSIVQTIVFSLVFGLALSLYVHQEKATHLLDTLREINSIVIRMVGLVMKIAPIGVFALLAATTGQMGLTVIKPMIKYLGVYGLATLVFLGLWLIVIGLVTRLPLGALIRRISRMSMMALATTSSAITLPVALKDTKTKLGVKDEIAQIVLSLGMSLNSNGSAMHMAITLVTISQIYNVQYSWGTLAYVAVLATLASLANAVVPGAALVSLTIVVPQMGLPIESIALFAGIDWFVGMLRTILNVDSDVFTSLIVGHWNDAIDFPKEAALVEDGV